MPLRRILALPALPAVLGAAVLSQALLAPSAEAAGPAHGCPYGAVCVYPQNRGWNGDRPSLKYWSYGSHNLSHQYGTHRIFNNQYGGAKIEACFGYNGTGGGTFDAPRECCLGLQPHAGELAGALPAERHRLPTLSRAPPSQQLQLVNERGYTAHLELSTL